jgi:hypothetical protein
VASVVLKKYLWMLLLTLIAWCVRLFRLTCTFLGESFGMTYLFLSVMIFSGIRMFFDVFELSFIESPAA